MNKFNLFSALAILVWLIVLIYATTIYAKSEDVEQQVNETENPVEVEYINPAYYKPAQEPVTYEDWFRANANVIPECEITHYCSESYEHICGTGDGITSIGVPVTPYWTCAVDPNVIPYWAEVMVDYGDHVEFWQAQDCGGAINGNHVDLAVQTHEEAKDFGVKTATVYWMVVEREFG